MNIKRNIKFFKIILIYEKKRKMVFHLTILCMDWIVLTFLNVTLEPCILNVSKDIIITFKSGLSSRHILGCKTLYFCLYMLFDFFIVPFNIFIYLIIPPRKLYTQLSLDSRYGTKCEFRNEVLNSLPIF